jgi:hypothetical protein
MSNCLLFAKLSHIAHRRSADVLASGSVLIQQRFSNVLHLLILLSGSTPAVLLMDPVSEENASIFK